MFEAQLWKTAAVAVVGLTFVAGASAQNDPIAQIDVNWNGSPTYAPSGYPAWGSFDPPALSLPGGTHTQTFGAIDLTLTPTYGPDNGAYTDYLDGRERSMDLGEGNDLYRKDVYNDFVFIYRNSAIGIGQNYFQYDLAGLDADAVIRVRMYNYDPDQSPSDANAAYMAYSTVDPGTNTNYQPAASNDGEYGNLTPMLQRGRYTGPWPGDPVINDPLAYTVEFTVPTDSSGNTTFYGWSDATSYSIDTWGRFNGMEVFTQLRGDMNFDDVVDANDAPLFNDIIAGSLPQADGLDHSTITSFAAGVDQGAHAWDAAADMNGDGVLDATDTALFNALVTPAIPGDLNGDGYVGLDDLQPILDHWNQNVTVGDASMGDIAGPGGTGPDGYVGLDDLQPVLDHWNEGVLPTPSSIPEPASLALLGLSGLTLLRRKA